jgi:beta-lactam-binding protein with PASTA domain
LPQFVGQPFRDATGSLKTLGLNVKLEFSSAGSNVPGTVVRQTPPAGAPLTGLQKVDLYVATVLL